MSIEQNNLPMRKKGRELVIETRPAYIEDWLETLPYADFHKTVSILTEAVKATNKVPMKAARRFELVTLYHRSYDYYIETQIRILSRQTTFKKGQHTSAAQDMKQYAIQLSHACKITVRDVLDSTSLFGQAKSPTQQALMSMVYLSHALIYSFIEYSPVPKKVWHEINSLYGFASGIGQKHTATDTLGESSTTTTIENTYKQILLASLSDPLHLPYGGIWELYEQLSLWAVHAQLQAFAEVKNPAGYFVVNTQEDIPPVSYSKFENSLANQHHLLLDANSLRDVAQNYLQTLESGKTTDNNFLLSKNTATKMLVDLGKSWGLPAQRYFPRKVAAGKIDIAAGMNACYYFHNDENDMAQKADPYQDTAISVGVEGDEHESLRSVTYNSEQWELTDQGSNGFCIWKTGQPAKAIRVGDLVGLKPKTNNPQNTWVLGVVRWLMVRQQNNYKAGIQTLSPHAQTVTIKALSGNPSICVKRRGFLTGDPKTGVNVSVITSRGLYAPQRQLEIIHQDKTYRVTTEKLLETGNYFEQFNYKII
ncbi:MAG: hypothetical protein DRQ58_00195 [Gammaproteobacteria bacterium]|nr:MAG: hypothetical protein DRQ58_00195 [Gammaproteobacteria bacterium]